MRVRAPTLGDVPQIVAVMNELSHALYGRPEVSEHELRLWFAGPDFDPASHAVVVIDDHGALAAYGDVSLSHKGRLVWIDPCVRPGAAEEVGPTLIDELELRAEAGLAPGGRLKAYVPERDEALAALLAARGYHVVRHSFRMEADLRSEPAEPTWPEGIAIRTFRRGADDRRVYEVQEETFADQFDAEPMSYEEWRHWSFGPAFDADLWFLAEAGDELVGILIARPERAGDDTVGWISVLGVRRPWRRRGLGRALLVHAFRELRGRGKLRAGLGVDGSNPTGAVRLYEAAGMEIVRRSDHWQKQLT
jgi:mycothiol synthase